MIYVVIWITLSILIGYLGRKKNIGFAGGLILSLLLSPLIGLIIVLVSGEPTDKQSKAISRFVYWGDNSYKAGKYGDAIDNYLKVTEMPGNSPNTHFKLAKIYAIQENTDLAMKHLNSAFEQGFKSFSSLQDSDLSYLRNQEEYKQFVGNGYKLRNYNELEKIDALEKLARLHKEGVISDDEFNDKKSKLLS